MCSTAASEPRLGPGARRVGDVVRSAVGELGGFAATLTWDAVPSEVRDRLLLVLLDHLGVTAAGATTDDGRALVAATDPAPGPAPVVGAGRLAVVDQAAWLNGTAACSLELDEGNKYARGHPAAHVLPAALAMAASRRVDGATLLAACLAGYEVAARFGAATRLHAGLHPHGNWGVTGAAAAVARLDGLDGDRTAAAIDAATGLVLATPFATALDGNPVRNAWVGAANVAGIAAARLAAAGHATIDRTASYTLGRLVGTLDPGVLTDGLGDRWHVTRGYFKRHASCSFTHPPADAVLAMRERVPGIASAAIAAVTVETHHLAAGLDRTAVPTRLAAMFSIPYVVAAAIRHGDLAPARFDAHHREDRDLATLAARVEVRCADDLDGRLPHHRSARVTIRLADGDVLVETVDDPVGDVDHAPFTAADVDAKLVALLEPAGLDPAVIRQVVAGLGAASDVSDLLQRLA